MQGAIVANYPWDGTEDRKTHYSESPDDRAFVHLARVYAEAHATMSGSAEFPGGITNGAHWYPLWGGMQVSLLLLVENLLQVKFFQSLHVQARIGEQAMQTGIS